MNYLSELFWNATLDEIKQGYIFRNETGEYICLICGRSFVKGMVYTDGKNFFEAELYTRIHLEQEHGSVFEYLLEMDQRYTGLTSLQQDLLRLFYQGCSDAEIVEKLDDGSPRAASTIRNHRFLLREREKQARIFLALMELLAERNGKNQGLVPVHRTATMVDERYAATNEEEAKILKTYFVAGPDGPLSEFPHKEKRKLIVLRQIIRRFKPGKRYTEQEVNEMLKNIYPPDFVTIRRYLIEYGFLDRIADGSAYWVKETGKSTKPKTEDKKTQKDSPGTDRREELKKQYWESHRPLGIYQIKNLTNGKIFIGSSLNLKGIINRDQFALRLGSHTNRELQQDWQNFGEESFIFEILEELKPSNDEPRQKTIEDLKALEESWLEKLQPFDDKGYNKRTTPGKKNKS